MVVVVVVVVVANVATHLINELQRWFPQHAKLDAFDIVYPQYWLQSYAKDTFAKHLDTLQNSHNTMMVVGFAIDKEVISRIMDQWLVDLK